MTSKRLKNVWTIWNGGLIDMNDTYRFKWIYLIANAMRKIGRNASQHPAMPFEVQKFSQGIILMASMPDSFIEANKQNFDKLEQEATIYLSQRAFEEE